MQQEVADQRRVVADRAATGETGEVLTKIDRPTSDVVELEITRFHVGRRARQLDVGQKQAAVVAARLALVVEQCIEDVCLQRVVRRREILDERPHLLEMGSADRRVIHVGIAVGSELRQVGVDEVRVRAQVGLLLEQLVHLRKQQGAVDVEFAELATLLRAEVGQDQVDEPFVVGPVEPREQGATAAGGQLDAAFAKNPVEGRVLEAGQIVLMRRRVTNEGLARHALRIEAGRQVRLLTGRLLALVAEMDPQFAAEPGESPLRVAIVGEQPLATLDQVAQPGRLRPLCPTFEHVAELVLLASVLVVQGVIEVIFLGAGNELLEDFRAIFGQGKRLDKADHVIGGSPIRGRRGKCDKEKTDRPAQAFTKMRNVSHRFRPLCVQKKQH